MAVSPTAPLRRWNDAGMSRTQGFTSWLKTHAKDQSAIGDLARDVAADPDWPSRRQLSGQREYLEERGAIPAAVETLERAWELYEARQEG
ncbi:YozE family protein [Streptomyces sp. DSM 116496]|uniref:YozE family protein n=2 Tax=Streptomyces TaxID=1883 RepID=UPI0038B2FAB2